MQIRSTFDSVSRGEISLLASIETVFAISIAVFISMYFETYLYLAISVSLAPFLLLRTEQSSKQAITIFALFFNKFTSKARKLDLENHALFASLLLPLLFVIIVISIFLIKIWVTLYNLLFHPVVTTKEIPINWYRVAFTVDSLYPPEIIPGLEALAKENNHLNTFRFSEFCDDFLNSHTKLKAVQIIVGLLMYLPAFLYRYSLKSTSIVYLPFIWLVNFELSEHSTKIEINYYLESKLERLKRIYAWIVLIFFSILPFYFFVLQNIDTPSFLHRVFIVYFLPISQIDSWHITRALSAFLTLALYFHADNIRIRLVHNDEVVNTGTTIFIQVAGKLRLIFALWTVVCGIYLVYSGVKWSGVPIIRWLPN